MAMASSTSAAPQDVELRVVGGAGPSAPPHHQDAELRSDQRTPRSVRSAGVDDPPTHSGGSTLRSASVDHPDLSLAGAKYQVTFATGAAAGEVVGAAIDDDTGHKAGDHDHHHGQEAHGRSDDGHEARPHGSHGDHDGAHTHHHHHHPFGRLWSGLHLSDPKLRRFVIMIFLVGGFMLLELIWGLIAHSLTLTADAMHMLSDLIALMVGFLGRQWARIHIQKSRLRIHTEFSTMGGFSPCPISVVCWYVSTSRGTWDHTHRGVYPRNSFIHARHCRRHGS